MTDIILGAADGYTWNDVRCWVNSIRQSGFDGEVWLVCYRVSQDLIDNCEANHINLYRVNHTPFGGDIQHQIFNSPTQSHNFRFYHFWELLTRLDVGRYGHCIITDVRDVVFQSNPIEYVDNIIKEPYLCVASEGIRYKDEDWGKNNIISGYGQVPYDLDDVGEWIIYNVGTMAGDASTMRHLCRLIYEMTVGRYYPSDQSSLNVLLNGFLKLSNIKIFKTEHDHYSWAAQCGTTLDPTKSYLWDRLIEPQPIIGNDGYVYSGNGMRFIIVHQWDRVPELKSIIEERYK